MQLNFLRLRYNKNTNEGGDSVVAMLDWSRLLLLVPLVLLSWWSTTRGLLGLVELGSGVPNRMVTLSIGCAVLVLTCLMSWTVFAIRQRTGSPLRGLFVCGYILLATISVGFGFGFYWSNIEARSSAMRTVAAEIDRTKERLDGAFARLDESLGALALVSRLSSERAAIEASVGGTCDTGSPPGNGPRFRLRMRDAQTFNALELQIQQAVGRGREVAATSLFVQKQVVEQRLTALVEGGFRALDDNAARAELAGVGQDLTRLVGSYGAFREGPTISSAIELLSNRANLGEGDIRDGKIVFRCDDPALAMGLRSAADGLAGLPPLPPMDLEVRIGADAIASAFQKLTNTLFNWSSWGVTKSEIEAAYLRCLNGKSGVRACEESFSDALAGHNRLNGRDAVPLMVAIAIDLFIFLLSAEPMRKERESRALVGENGQGGEGTLTQLLRQLKDADQEFLSMVLEHTFWHRGAYFLAMPVGSRGEVGLSPAEHSLSLAAMVLVDMGYARPTGIPLTARLVRRSLIKRFGRMRTRTIRHAYDVYRLEPGGLKAIVDHLSTTPIEVLLPLAPPPSVPAVKAFDWRTKFASSQAPADGIKVDAADDLIAVSDQSSSVEVAPPAPNRFSGVASGIDSAIVRWVKTNFR